MAAKFQPIWWLKFGQFGVRPNFGPFSGRISARLLAEFKPIWRPKFKVLFRPPLDLFSGLFSDFRNRPSFGLPYRNENVPEIPDRYFRVSGLIFTKIHRTSKMLPECIALLRRHPGIFEMCIRLFFTLALFDLQGLILTHQTSFFNLQLLFLPKTAVK